MDGGARNRKYPQAGVYPRISALLAGTVLTAALLQEVIGRDRIGLVDFCTGGDPFKRDWMNDSRPRYP